jgi:predicted transcriptional regulator
MGAMSGLAGDVMTGNVISVRGQAQYGDIVVVMRERGFSACAVLDAGGTVVAVVPEDDLLAGEAYAGQTAWSPAGTASVTRNGSYPPS